MFNLTGSQTKEFHDLFEMHRMNVSATNIYFQNLRLLNTRKPKLLTRDDYQEYYKGILDDITLESPPIDTLIPNEAELPVDENGEYIVPDDYPLFVTNQLVPEYVKIKSRIEGDNINELFPDTHTVRMTINEKPEMMETLIDEIFIHWLTFKYLAQIDLLHLQTLSNMTPVIEYVVKNITLSDIKKFVRKTKVNDEKVKKWYKSIIFEPDLARTKKFYEDDHPGFPVMDVPQILKVLISNLDLVSDIYIITAIYLTLSFAMSDIFSGKVEDSECAKYVRDVLSKII